MKNNNNFILHGNENCSSEETTEFDSAENQYIQQDHDGCFFVKVNEKIICCFTVIGQIEGHYLLSSQSKTTKYENIIPKLIECETNENVFGILFVLNTVGGDIEAGMAIAELISGLSKPTVSIVLGGGHSIGIPLAVAAKKSYITQSGTMTIHPVRTNGLVMGVPQQFAYFNDMQERIVKFVCRNSTVDENRFREMMLKSGQLVADFGTVLDGEEAVKEGLIDSIGTVKEAIDELIKM